MNEMQIKEFEENKNCFIKINTTADKKKTKPTKQKPSLFKIHLWGNFKIFADVLIIV